MGTQPRKLLMIVSNPTQNLKGSPVGFWGCELSHPYFEFTSAGCAVDVVSPDGGKLELDAGSDPRNKDGFEAKDMLTMGFLNIPVFAALIANSRKLSDIDPTDYDAMMLCGGQAAIHTFRNHDGVKVAVRKVFEAGKVLAALCYGVSALLDVKLSTGQYLLAGKTVTGFSNAEEDVLAAGDTGPANPFRIQNAVHERGAVFTCGAPFTAYAHRDGRLITGQQKCSSRAIAQAVLAALA
jgi:putative intracellular protease/amidase